MRISQNNPKIFILSLVLVLIIALGVFLILRQTIFSQISRQKGSITIQDAYLTLDPELSKPTPGQIPSFPTDTNRIYLAVFLESEIPVHLGVRWYFEDELIFKQSGSFDRPFVWHIQVETAEGFIPGNYRAEIFLIEEPVRVLEFKIEDTN